MSKISEIKEIVKENFKHQKAPLFLHGSPGIGKTEAIEQAANELAKECSIKDFVFRTIILSQYESVDLRGLPSIKDNKSVWNPPDDLVFDPEAEGIVFFDEMSNAVPDVQKASQQIIHARRLGSVEIPPGIVFIAAGNRQADKAGANKILTALANRFEHHNVEVDADDWLAWAMQNNIEHEIIAFINKFGMHLNDFDSNRHINATPRTWVKVHHLMGSQFFHARVYGTIGSGIGGEFLAFRTLWKEIPDLELIWKSPNKVEMPKKQDIVYATCMSLALKATPKNFPAALIFMEKAGKEFQVMFVKNASQACKEVRKTAEWNNFIKSNQDVMFS
jgi:DNA polymerase III delta prime subunit